MATPATATNLSYVGWAKETTPGTPVTATVFTPFTSVTPHDIYGYLEDRAMRGSMAPLANVVLGTAHAEYEIQGNVHPDTIGHPIMGVLGKDTVTGAGPYSHVLSTLNNAATASNQPPTYTMVDFDGVVTTARQMAYFMFSEVTFNFSPDTLLTYTTHGIGRKSGSVAAPTNVPTTTAVMPGWNTAVTIGGSGNTKVLSGSLSIKRGLVIPDTLNASQDPTMFFGGDVTVDGSLSFIPTDDTERALYSGNTQPAVVITITQPTSNYSIAFQMTKCAFRDAQANRGQEYVTLPMNFTAVANTTDATAGATSPIKVTISNNQSAAY